MRQRTPRRASVKADERSLTTTSYAILGLLSVGPWSAYELGRQMHRSLRFHWPRAQSRVYLEAPNLVAHGLATATERPTGARRRTEYSITPAGRRALRRWLAEPSAVPQFEAEALLRSLFADSGSRDDLVRTFRQLADEAHAERQWLLRQGRAYLEDGGPFPHRLHLIALNGRFSLGLTKLLEDWARWAEAEVESWSTTNPIRDPDEAIARFRAIIGDDLVQEILATEPDPAPADARREPG